MKSYLKIATALSLLLLCSFSLIAKTKIKTKLIDKIVGVINEKNVSLSEVRRVKSSLKGRKEISPILYSQIKTDKDIIEHFFHIFVVRKELSTLGYSVSDQRVEAQIQSTLKNIRLTKRQLIEQLAKSGVTFDEYFSVIKESMEFNLFNQKVISPLVVISEQEVKSLYNQKVKTRKSSKSANNQVLYDITDYLVESKAAQFQKTISKLVASKKKIKLDKVEIIELGEVKSSGLTPQIRKHLANVKAGEVAKPLKIAGYYHIFHVKKKSKANSDNFDKIKRQVANYLFEQKSRSVIKSYFEQKISQDYYTKSFAL